MTKRRIIAGVAAASIACCLAFGPQMAFAEQVTDAGTASEPEACQIADADGSDKNIEGDKNFVEGKNPEEGTSAVRTPTMPQDTNSGLENSNGAEDATQEKGTGPDNTSSDSSTGESKPEEDIDNLNTSDVPTGEPSGVKKTSTINAVDEVSEGDTSETSEGAIAASAKAKASKMAAAAAQPPASKADVSYQAHVQDIGWQRAVKDGAQAGTTGRSKRVEGIRIIISGNVAGGVTYRAHVQNIGWQGWVSDGQLAGTTGRALRVEALQAKLRGDLASRYSLQYRAHVQNIGWQNWVEDGETAGTTGRALRIEAIEIRLVKIENGAYRMHVQDIGWQPAVSDGSVAGTTGQSKRAEAVRIYAPKGATISYRAHVQNVGWQGWKSSGALAGTTGQALRLEAIEIKMTGASANKYDVYYRAHSANIGWLGTAKNGATAGTTSFADAIEALQVWFVPKSSQGTTTAPKTSGSVVSVPSLGKVGVSYRAHLQGGNWQGWKADGATAGTTGQSRHLDEVEVQTGIKGLTITYQVYETGRGWPNGSSNGSASGQAGTMAQGLRVSLGGELAKYYDVYYRAHVSNEGWLGWASNNRTAGSSGRGYGLEAFQIMITIKGGSHPSGGGRADISYLIYLDAGHGKSGSYYDSGATGNGYHEADLTNDLVRRVESYARNLYGLNVIDSINDNANFTDRPMVAKNRGATSLVSIHFNAGGGRGTESYISTNEWYHGQWRSAASGSEELRSCLHGRLVGALGLPDRGKKRNCYAVINSTNNHLPATLLEICFIDSSDMKTYIAKRDDVARALAAGLRDAVNRGVA